MIKTLKVACAQVNFMVGDCDYNANNVIKWAAIARDQLQADVIIFPELTLVGYPPEDLLLRPELYQQIDRALTRICEQVTGIAVVLGYPEKVGDALYNAACVIHNQKIIAEYRKQKLPNYSVFDEKRYFKTGDKACVFQLNDIPIALMICEDLWFSAPMQQAQFEGAKVIFSMNASPFDVAKEMVRIKTLRERIAENKLPIVYVHWAGGQDEFVFDGGSLAIDQTGEVTHHAGYFNETCLCVPLSYDGKQVSITEQTPYKMPSALQLIYQALVMGVRDYVQKNKGHGAILGLSGGIDSALTIAIAVDALGNDNVEALIMPSRYTAEMSVEDATKIAENLNVMHSTISIETIFEAFNHALAPRFENLAADITEENLQARIRGTLLMAVSNKTGKLVLATGNKSETAVGFSTLYGDMVGALDVLKDVSKTLVYDLVRWRNQQQAIIPERVITRPPSAELNHDQTDQQRLPPYDILDAIMAMYVEQDKSVGEIIAAGYDKKAVEQVTNLIDRYEYKRRQAAPGIRVSGKAFGRDRRYPITSGFRSFIKEDEHEKN